MGLPKVGQTLRYPEDRGSKGGTAKVVHVDTRVCKNINGVLYVWITLAGGTGVWPSHRLGYKIEGLE